MGNRSTDSAVPAKAHRSAVQGTPHASAQPYPSCETKISRILTGLSSSQTDAHSIAALCRMSPIGVAAPTFCRWCARTGIKPAGALRFARLLRAICLAEQAGTSPSVWMDVDPRTYRRMLTRAGLSVRGVGHRLDIIAFLESQQLIQNKTILACMKAALYHGSPRGSVPPR